MNAPEKKPRKRIMLRASYASLVEAGDWRPIPDCPGRSVLHGVNGVTPVDLVGSGTAVQVFKVKGAPDPVHVAEVTGGGLISFAKSDGRFVHTLNTPEGFARKLAELGIAP